MGVMPCYRKNCEGIMCTQYSHKHGYICSDCFEELVAINPNSITDFMSTARPESDTSEDPEERFNREFPPLNYGDH